MSLRALLAAAWILSAIAGTVLLAAADAGIVLVAVTAALLAAAGAILVMAWHRTARAFEVVAEDARAVAAGGSPGREQAVVMEEAEGAAAAMRAMADGVGALLQASERERTDLVAALNSSLDAVIAVDSEGRVAFANAGAERLLDRGRDEMIGNPFAFVMPNAQLVEAIRASHEEGRQETHTIERPNRQFLRAITTPIVGSGAWSALVVIHDLSDVRRVEQMRRDFVANVSHELRTPLAALKSVIETLAGGAMEDPETARDFLGRADTEIERLVQMVEELLELSRIESGDVALSQDEVDLKAVVGNAVDRVRTQAEREGLTLELTLPDAPAAITGDAVRLERAVLNLVHNAVKFTPEGGRIEVSVSVDDGTAAVRVSDTGVGIDAEDLPRVFERFYKTDRSRRAGGTGLGLAVVKHTVEAHGGRVWAESEPERGSRFSLTLPMRTADAPVTNKAPKL